MPPKELLIHNSPGKRQGWGVRLSPPITKSVSSLGVKKGDLFFLSVPS